MDPADIEYLRQAHIPKLIDDLILQLLGSKPDLPVKFLAELLAKQALGQISSEDAIMVLKSSPYFQDLGDQHLALIASNMDEQVYLDGQALIEEKAPNMSAFFIVEGQVERSRFIDGQHHIFEMVQPGNAFGILHCIREDPSYARAVARGSVRAYTITSSKLSALLGLHAALGKAFTNSLAKAVRNYTKLVYQPQSVRPRLVLYDSKSYWQSQFDRINVEQNFGFEIKYVTELFCPETAVWAEGATAVICFVNDDTSRLALQRLHATGCKMLSMRCAGYDRVDLHAARALGILVTRVPEYSPFAVAEHAIALAMALNRRICRAYNRTREHDFKLEGLLGFDFHGRTVGVLGTGRIGQIFINICLGLGMKVVCYDKYPNKALMDSGTVHYATMDEVFAEADIISLHCPLLAETRHVINEENIAKMKKGALLINCGRGGLIDSNALIEGLRSGQLGGAGLDVYENESAFFFHDHSDDIMQDSTLQQLLQFNNVILTAHQAFFTEEGIGQIALTSLTNIKLYMEGKDYDTHPNVVKC